MFFIEGGEGGGKRGAHDASDDGPSVRQIGLCGCGGGLLGKGDINQDDAEHDNQSHEDIAERIGFSEDGGFDDGCEKGGGPKAGEGNGNRISQFYGPVKGNPMGANDEADSCEV